LFTTSNSHLSIHSLGRFVQSFLARAGENKEKAIRIYKQVDNHTNNRSDLSDVDDRLRYFKK